MITQTSLEAYLKIKNTLPHRQSQVIQALEELGNATNRMIAVHLGLYPNNITPRIKELRQKGRVVPAYVGKDITGVSAIFWKLKQRDADAETNDAY